jgi:hypothetical protein
MILVTTVNEYLVPGEAEIKMNSGIEDLTTSSPPPGTISLQMPLQILITS